jgi:hypothetical protein
MPVSQQGPADDRTSPFAQTAVGSSARWVTRTGTDEDAPAAVQPAKRDTQ